MHPLEGHLLSGLYVPVPIWFSVLLLGLFIVVVLHGSRKETQ